MATDIAIPESGDSSFTDLHGCPDREELLAFNRGTLPLALIKSVAIHIQRCPTCETNLSTLQREGETRSIPSPMASPDDEKINVQVEDSNRLVLVDLPIDFSRSEPSRLSKGSKRILETPLRLGQYHLVEKIGQGGMGVVYKAWHERLKREVAIKFLPLDQLDKDEGVELFQQEMAAVGNVNHSNVVFATDAGESEGVHFLVMEFVQGLDLAKLTAKLTRLEVADACELIRQAAVGLEHISQAGLVHRDLKPSNLMLSRDGTVKIMDLGLARLRLDLADESISQRSRKMMGTIDYVSPEQSRNSSLADIRSDIYSLGCTLFKLLCGAPPFSGENFESVEEKLQGHRRQLPPRLNEVRGGVPAEVDRIVAKALAKQPGERFQSPLELASALVPHCRGNDLSRLLRQANQVSGNSLTEPFLDSRGTPSTFSFHLDDSHSVAQPASTEEPLAPSAASPSERSTRSWWTSVALISLLLTGLVLGGGYGAIKYAYSSISPALDPGLSSSLRFSKSLEETGEYKWVGYDESARNIISVDGPLQIVTLESDEQQLIQIGKYPGGKGHFRYTIDQRSSLWSGSCGVVLGLRNEILKINGVPELATVYQVISLQRLGGHLQRGPYGMRVLRRKIFIDPHTHVMIPLDSKAENHDIAFPGPLKVLEFDIEFDKKGISRILCNGEALDELTTPQVNSWFEPEDYRGTLGFFNYGHHGTRFSSVDISPFEPLVKD